MTAIRDTRAAFLDAVETAARAAIMAGKGLTEDNADEFTNGIIAKAAATSPIPPNLTVGEVRERICRVGIAIAEREMEQGQRQMAEAFTEHFDKLSAAVPRWSTEQKLVEAGSTLAAVLAKVHPDWTDREVMTEVQRIVAVGPCRGGRVMSTVFDEQHELVEAIRAANSWMNVACQGLVHKADIAAWFEEQNFGNLPSKSRNVTVVSRCCASCGRPPKKPPSIARGLTLCWCCIGPRLGSDRHERAGPHRPHQGVDADSSEHPLWRPLMQQISRSVSAIW